MDTQKYQNGLLHSPVFDFTFVIGIAVLAIATGILVSQRPELFWPILMIDLWFLGYHHVVSTYTRLIFDRDSFKEHRSLVVYLPIAVAAAVTLVALSMGTWALATIYLHWQWYHYTRQSEGVCKAYGAKSRDKDLGNLLVSRLAFYAVPLAGILHVSAQNPTHFLGMPVKTIIIPEWLLGISNTLAIALVIMWLYQQLKSWKKGQLAKPYFIYMLSHFSIFSVAYIWIADLSIGWLTVNIWHNAQYILFVWLFNNRRFGGKVDDKSILLSTLSQNGRFLLYTLACFSLSSVMYLTIQNYGVSALISWTGIPITVAALVIYQTINFHHYIVDSIIWKLRKKSIRSKFTAA